MPTDLQPVITEAVSALKNSVGDNLYSCCLYGSAVRGNFIEDVSDINLLIVLNESKPSAHEAIAVALAGRPLIDPFVLGRPGFERSVRAFASKFASIQRNYRVLHGADPLAAVKVEPELEKFLCEQGLRNLRLRLVYAFITRQRYRAYDRFLLRSVTPIFVRIGEVLRLDGREVPKSFTERIGLFERQLGLDGSVLRELLELKSKSPKLRDADAEKWHERVFTLLNQTILWIESHWPNTRP
jgi:hypothetical protein